MVELVIETPMSARQRPLAKTSSRTYTEASGLSSARHVQSWSSRKSRLVGVRAKDIDGRTENGAKREVIMVVGTPGENDRVIA